MPVPSNVTEEQRNALDVPRHRRLLAQLLALFGTIDRRLELSDATVISSCLAGLDCEDLEAH